MKLTIPTINFKEREEIHKRWAKEDADLKQAMQKQDAAGRGSYAARFDPKFKEATRQFQRLAAARKPMKPDAADREDERAAAAKERDAQDLAVGAGKYAGASTAQREKMQRAPKSTQTGKRGGVFYVTATGAKVYVKR